ncbi:hypothetical protein [Pseudomonas sp. SCB32]|uniref:hypothetical protein n=1 Tax=Pseudomonas sp. SCB32 TaxID=2653853 RepID=UPI0021153232|nr:hypothetical protein [Pseudomonas sp. SCB32]
MNNDQKNVVHLHQRDPQSALERLNRITGLQFSSWPESLLPTVQGELKGSSAQVEAELESFAQARQLG